MAGPLIVIKGHIDQLSSVLPHVTKATAFQKIPCQKVLYPMAGSKKQRLNSAAHSFSKHIDKEQSSELGQSWVFIMSRSFCFYLHRVSRFSSLRASTATFSFPSFQISSTKHH